MSVSPEESTIDRRALLRRAAAVGLVTLPGAGLLSACATSGGGDSGDTGGGKKTAANPLGVKEDAPLDVVIFPGGYTDKYATDIHEPLYQTAFPKAKIKHEAVTEIDTTLRPRFASGTDIPDMVNNSGSKEMDFGALVNDGQLADLTPLLDAPSVHDPSKKVRDTLQKGTVDFGSYNGKPYVLFYVSTVWGVWYSGKLFTDRGWSAPSDWNAFLALCEEIKKAGITPFGYAGANAAYYMWNVILTHAAKLGGPEVVKAIDNLEDGAWKHDAIKQAATAWAEVGAKYMDKAYEGLRHTDVQLQQNQYKLAFYPSGDWLENEQKKDTPADFKYQMMPVPVKGKLSAAAVRAGAGEGYFVPAKSKNKAGGMEYLRRMLSMDGAKGFAELIKSPTVMTAGSEGVTFPPGVTSSRAAFKAAGQDTFDLTWDKDYKPLDVEARTQTNALMFGRITPDQFCERVQKKADEVKNDKSIIKFKR
ncbi:N-acetylglucosamine/diacetylchitobiose ABC transporter substrate-binding protein [Planosporangium mesophilum]|uniref:Carbohydrate ABC transporter, N-acetylglucosamine/diacetylchitobiose-binding protein n=1 Tax=Planosporangium mesophilum TaxID=689768 RepID=A0A8J3X2C2_9ACTN|nr:N-acetylglucosamine/diacetylchitobiose ABC transporter substrate-binding protein [Planosporangium mesophilum]NJC83389.1 carbohydrate ABC transporter, N-acetylglucosamine/diacetylchitobiose-binding protein [Planosporangium mesophilum]GII21768.1 carbohydrate ABC transporter, N-acetylglucosamine/diacetylchitobiose-binding protein [Planosporangium mesophilum]